MTKTRLASTRASAAWAAWGDALGFITELTDAPGLKHRAGVERVDEPRPWRRRVGGRMGVQAALPAGAYSDDTQLRLASGRAIRGDGEFDVDSFARVELVAWQAYHLGAGRGSKAAAVGMSRTEARWSQNTFATKDSRYVDVGGNGAAMRIQPHVWSAPDLNDPTRVLRRVLRDTVCTHGHPVGIVGAAFHALCLMVTMSQGAVPDPSRWSHLVDMAGTITDAIASDDDLGSLWRPAWELAAERPLAPALREALKGLDAHLGRVRLVLQSHHENSEAEYRAVLNAVGGLEPATRGSGIGTAVAALALAATATVEDPVAALQIAANTLGSDTDTIATMAGALIGAVIADRPPTQFQDARYVDLEAYRMHTIAVGDGSSLPTFRYPDLFKWTPPRSALDLVGETPDGTLALAGIGPLRQTGPEARGVGSRSPSVYQWMELPFGQTVFVRFRPQPRQLPPGLLPVENLPPKPIRTETPESTQREQLPVGTTSDQSSSSARPPAVALTVDQALAAVREQHYSPGKIGELLRTLIDDDSDHAVERAAAFAAAVACDLKGDS